MIAKRGAHVVEARPPRGPVQRPSMLEGADEVATYIEDASRFPGGRTERVYLPRTEGEVAWVLREEPRVLPQGAQSSLTGGAVPDGDAVLQTSRMDAVGPIEGDRVRVGPGVALVTLAQRLVEADRFYPPAPTFDGAFVGGTVATNAAGAATWKYGTTRRWVEGLTVVLASGEVLDLERGAVTASPEGTFEVVAVDGSVTVVSVPGYAMPEVPKCSAGYHAAPGMDLVDLFIGSEGTLGVVTEVTLRLLEEPPAVLWCLVPLRSEAAGVELVGSLRDRSRLTWMDPEGGGIDVRAIEHVDRRSIEILREEGKDRETGITFGEHLAMMLLVALEVPRAMDAEAATEAMAAFAEGRRPPSSDLGASAIVALLRILDGYDVAEDTLVAMPGDARRAGQLFAVREAVPVAVNHRVEKAKREVDAGIHKVAADMIVPYERFGEMMDVYREAFGSRGLDVAIWGHISDGNVHPNVIPSSLADVTSGEEAILELGREVVARGGSPLAEHGVGRNPLKQALLRQLYGEEGIEQMRATRRALDPAGKLARGVLFPHEDR